MNKSRKFFHIDYLLLFSVGRSGFGIESNMQNDIDNIYLKKSAEVVELNYDKLFAVRLCNLMPFLKPYLIAFVIYQLKITRALGKILPSINYFIEELAPFWIINRAQEIVNYRKLHSSEKKSTDLLQLMIDAEVSNENQVCFCLYA